MKNKIVLRVLFVALLGLSFAACTKEGLQKPPHKPAEQPPPVKNDTTVKIKLQAVVTIGAITYDSLPAQWRITSWDVNNVPYQKDTLLAAGVNTVTVPKDHIRFRFRLNKWGITDELMLRKDQLQEDVVYTLGGQKAAKRLRKEENFRFVMQQWEPSSRIHYAYGNNGLSAVEFYQKMPQYSALQFTQKHLYQYNGSAVSRINVFDETNAATGFTEFTYNPQGTKVTHIHQQSYDVETFAAVEHSYRTGTAEITIDYLYNNGNAMEYVMKMRGGNKVEERAISSTGGGEGGTFTYDLYINPFAHMNMPDIFISNLSKNNLVDEQKNYSGNIPSAVVYKREYTYDSDGYPVEVVKHYKGYQTNEHLYTIKTVYTYL
ncbi:hypothetical protein ACX0G7_23660 [Flavitalea antarctica]